MAYATQRFSLSGTGSTTLITNLTNAAATGCRITAVGKNSTTTKNISIGSCDGTRQNAQATNALGSTSSKIIDLRDDTGSSVIDASWTSFTYSGGAARVTLNVTTNNENTNSMTLEVWN